MCVLHSATFEAREWQSAFNVSTAVVLVDRCEGSIFLMLILVDFTSSGLRCECDLRDWAGPSYLFLFIIWARIGIAADYATY